MNTIFCPKVCPQLTLILLIVLLFGAPESHGADLSRDVALLRGHEFHCNTGYSVPECLRQLRLLQSELQHYDVSSVGNWSWVLVRSEDWKPLMRRLGLNPTTPAFTELHQRTTFLEEVLFVPDPVRAEELLLMFQIPLNQIRDLAITHELGHALCSLVEEDEADHVGEVLRASGAVSCPLRQNVHGRAENPQSTP